MTQVTADEPPAESVADYCRAVEAYLCQRNDGHLVRVVGPSFDVVSRWETSGVPIKVVQRGIDRYVERAARRAGRRRPVRIEFCEADVLDVFDEWRRALGLSRADEGESGTEGPSSEPDAPGRAAHRGTSLPAHLQRVLLRLTSARATNRLGPLADAAIDRVSRELDVARASSGGVRGAAREALLERLAAIDVELVALVRATLDEPARAALGQHVQRDLAAYRGGMTPEAYTRAYEAAFDAQVREWAGLPTVAWR